LQLQPARHSAHRAIQRNPARGFQGQVARAGPGQWYGKRDIAILSARTARKPGGNHHIGGAKRCHQRVNIDHAVICVWRKARIRCLRAIRNGDVIRVQQQRAPGAERRAQICKARVVQHPAGGDLGLTTITALHPAARADAPREIRADFRPQHNITAIAAHRSIGGNDTGLIHRKLIGPLQRPVAKPVSANPHPPAASGARGIHLCPAQRDIGARDRHIAAAPCRAAGIHPARDRNIAAFTAGKHDRAGASRNRRGVN